MRALAVMSVVALATAAVASAATIIGNDSANVIVGSGSADYIEGNGGNDQIDARAGADEVRAGTGADTAYGGTGNDDVIGGDGNDRLYAGCPNGACNAGSNVIFGGNGNDVVGADNGKVDQVNCAGGSGDVAYVDSRITGPAARSVTSTATCPRPAQRLTRKKPCGASAATRRVSGSTERPSSSRRSFRLTAPRTTNPPR